MECPYCGESPEFLIKMPVTVVKQTIAGEATFSREGYKSDKTPDNICFSCLRSEAKEVLE